MSEDIQSKDPDVVSHPDDNQPQAPLPPPLYLFHLRRILSADAKTEEDIRTDAIGLTANPQSTESGKKKARKIQLINVINTPQL